MFFGFGLDVAYLLCELVQRGLEVGVLHLQLCEEVRYFQDSKEITRARWRDVPCCLFGSTCAAMVLVVMRSREIVMLLFNS